MMVIALVVSGPGRPRSLVEVGPSSLAHDSNHMGADAISVYTMQKELGKDAELSAAEVVRRAERCIALAIRKGQAEGSIKKRGDGGLRNPDGRNATTCAEWGPDERRDAYAMTDGVTDSQFDSAIDEAKAERNLSRANVVRKIRGQMSKERRAAWATSGGRTLARPQSACPYPHRDPEAGRALFQRAARGYSASRGRSQGFEAGRVHRVAQDCRPASECRRRGSEAGRLVPPTGGGTSRPPSGGGCPSEAIRGRSTPRRTSTELVAETGLRGE